MKSLRPIHAFVVLCFLLAPSSAFSQTGPVVLAGHPSDLPNTLDVGPLFIPDDPSIPEKMLAVMLASQKRYQEGARLIKAGESAKAREEFDIAVDIVLNSEWDLPSTPVLNRFFQELIQQIQQDQLRYPGPSEGPPEPAEAAVVDELEKLDLIPIKVDPSLQDMVEADLAGTTYDIPITLNERVLQSLNYWLNRGRKLFAEGLVRSGRYREMIQKIFREAEIPQDLMYLAQVESLFKTNAVSRRQARGIWQFGAQTAIRYGLKVNSYIDERSDPEKSTRAATRYLNDLYKMFQDWNLVLAAYNWGEGRVQRLVNRSGLNDFWDLMDLRRNFPEETKNHVPLIAASIILARNPEKYGLTKELEPALTYDRVAVSKPIDLRAAAKVLGIRVEQLKQLNPELRRFITPPGYPNYELKIPGGTSSHLVEKLASLPVAKPEPLHKGRHRVRQGETLSQIAAKYKVSIAALQEANLISSPKSLRVGTWLRIPSPPVSTRKTNSNTKSATYRRARPLIKQQQTASP